MLAHNAPDSLGPESLVPAKKEVDVELVPFGAGHQGAPQLEGLQPNLGDVGVFAQNIADRSLPVRQTS
jgi:hypothetical protein